MRLRDNNDLCSLLTTIVACRKSLGLSVAMVSTLRTSTGAGFGSGFGCRGDRRAIRFLLLVTCEAGREQPAPTRAKATATHAADHTEAVFSLE